MLIRKRFDAADTNHDGALSREEAKATQMISHHFDEIDANHDGLVTLAEIQAMMNGNRAAAPAVSAVEPAMPGASAPAAAKP
jgi:Ca2+-binding EF-hand superfamily protein